MKVLIVEDRFKMAQMLKRKLHKNTIHSDIALDEMQAFDYIKHQAYDVVVLDRDMSTIDERVLCDQIVKKMNKSKIFMISSVEDISYKLNGFQMGADDYLIKPFYFQEFLFRIKALERSVSPKKSTALEYLDLKLDPFNKEVYRNDQVVKLCKKEFAILELLMEEQGNTVTKDTMLDKVWGGKSSHESNVVRVTIFKLRKNLGFPNIIKNIFGHGYKIE